MKYFIITGASKGLGEGIALALLEKNHHLICLGRSESHELKRLASAKGCQVDFFKFDLAETQNIAALFDKVKAVVNTDNAEAICLINNAGVLEPVGRIETCAPQDVEYHLRINLIAPILLSAEFIKAFTTAAVLKRILNISSGAAQNPYYGWSSYCTGKAGIDMHSRCIAEEQKGQAYPVEAMAVAPGVIDTQMQTLIRSKSEEQFIHKQKFVDLKEQGLLVAPTLAGKRLADLLLSDEFRSGAVIDLRDK